MCTITVPTFHTDKLHFYGKLVIQFLVICSNVLSKFAHPTRNPRKYARKILPDRRYSGVTEERKKQEMVQNGLTINLYKHCSPLAIAKAFLLLAEKYAYMTGFDINNYFETIDECPLLELAVQGLMQCQKNALGSQQHAAMMMSEGGIEDIPECNYEHEKIISLLLEHGCDVNVQNIFGYTASYL